MTVENSEPIAIVGIGCRLPGEVNGPESYWKLLCEGTDALGDIPADRLPIDAFYHPEPGRPGKTYVRTGGFLDGIDQFDAEFFGISPKEASRIDPQQRLTLECTWEALEDAGADPGQLATKKIGVFIGISTDEYLHLQARDPQSINAYTNTGGRMCIAANRISYVLDLKGPSETVETACSSSLVAVHRACQSLHTGESETALAGGVNVILSLEAYVGYCQATMLSPTGRCWSFDSRADGYVRGEGCGIVVLKRLSQAEADGDRIYAVLLATGTNQDGRTLGLSRPSADAQSALLREVYGKAGVMPANVHYVEAHGTGTPAGDPIECEALGRVLGQQRAQALQIGSVKTNIGHLHAAAGIAGLIKTALSIQHRQLPPSLNFELPNPEIPLDRLGLSVHTSLTPWPSKGPALAGVNSFGFGGTNAHVVVGEYRAVKSEALTKKPFRPPFVLPLSAQCEGALKQLATRYAKRIRGCGDAALTDICYSAARRGQLPVRAAVIGDTVDELRQRLHDLETAKQSHGVMFGRVSEPAQRLVFVCCGNGPQWWGMGRGLLEHSAVFRQSVEECDQSLRRFTSTSLLHELLRDEANSRMDQTDVAQPALFALQVGLIAVWRSWGINADATVGHSVGEIAAAWASGILSLDDAMRVVFHRSRLQARTAGTGRMAAVELTVDEAERSIAPYNGRLCLAAQNGSNSVTISGDTSPLAELIQSLQTRHVACKDLGLDYAFHSRTMDPLQDEFTSSLEGISPKSAHCNFVSTLSGEAIDGRELGAEYWWKQMRQPVRFAPAMASLTAAGCNLFVEIGPHPVLGPYVSECLGETDSEGQVLPSLRRNRDALETMRASLAALYTRGVPINWAELYSDARFVRGPTYPWQKKRHWNEATSEVRRKRSGTINPLLGSALDGPRLEWEAELDVGLLTYLRDHRVRDTAVFPMAGYVEIGLSVGRQVYGGEPCAVEHLEIHKGLTLPEDGAKTIRTLASSDGSFEIVVAAPAVTDGWITLVKGDVRRLDANPPAPWAIEEIRQRCGTEIGHESFYEDLVRRGMNYGPQFRVVERVFAGDGEALGELCSSASVEPEKDDCGWRVTLLDACFQVARAAVAGNMESQTRTYLPVSFRKLLSFSWPSSGAFCHVKSVRIGPDSTTQDLTLLDELGRVLARFEGSRRERFDAQRDRLDDSLYELRWEDSPLREDDTSGFSTVPSPEILAAASAKWTPSTSPADDGFDDAIDQLCLAYVFRALSKLGVKWAPGSQLDTRVLVNELHPQRQWKWLLGRFFEMLAAAGAVRQDGATWRMLREPKLPDPTECWGELWKSHPDRYAELLLVRRLGSQLADILRGQADPRPIVYPKGSWGTLEAILGWSRTSFGIAREFLVRLVVEQQAAFGQRLRIIEIGGKAGDITASLLALLSPDQAELWFTDAHAAAVRNAKKRFGAYRSVRCKSLDPDEDLEAQGIEPNTFDVVVCADALSTTRNAAAALGRIRRLLRPGGLLLIAERRDDRFWPSFLFGLTDQSCGDGCPALDTANLRTQIDRSGLADVVDLSERIAGVEPGHSVIAARAPTAKPVGVTAKRTARVGQMSGAWFVFADRGSVGTELGRALRAAGASPIQVVHGERFEEKDDGFQIRPADRDDMQQLLQAVAKTGQSLAGAIHLWSLDAPATTTATLTELDAAQRLSSASAMCWVQSLASANLNPVPRLFLVTRGVHALPDERERGEPIQAPLWGFGRCLMSEHPELRCTLIDLDEQLESPELAARTLMEELESAGHEEILLRAGRRYVNWMVHCQASARDSQLEEPYSAFESYRLELGEPGNLDSLKLRSDTRRPPVSNEVEIDVRAAGLNFKDIMVGTGLLSGAALEHGYAGGATLGLECAGTVVAVGDEVAELRPGDRVIAFARHAFRRYVTVASQNVAKIPAALSFTKAATIPVTFFTAYYALRHLGRLQAGERVLIHGAAGGVGQAAIQIVQSMGGEVFATAGTSEKRELLRYLGVRHVMDSRSLAFADEVLQATNGEGVDIVLNSLSGQAIPRSLGVLRPLGRFLEIGKRDLVNNTRLGLRPFQNNLCYFAIDADQLKIQNPALTASVFREIMSHFEAGTFQPLPHVVFPVTCAADAFRFMQQAKHMGKIVLSFDSPEHGMASIEPAPLKPAHDAAYVISGGLGGFGMATARWLAGLGARHLILLGRRGLRTPGALEAINELKHSGVRVRVAEVDVTQREQLSELLEEVRREGTPIRGVVHAAMVLDDGMIVDQSEDRFREVLAPKMLGAWNLHALTAQDTLEFFVMFSSEAAMRGNAGQSNYCAANLFLDAFAWYRRSRGLPALTVSWGAIEDVGVVARSARTRDSLARHGVEGIDSSTALEMLRRLLDARRVHVGVARLSWAGLHNPPGRLLRLVRSDQAAADADDESVPPIDRLRAAAPGERNQILRGFIVQEVQTVLGMTMKAEDLNRSFPELGMDSLTATELRIRLGAAFGTTFPQTLAYDFSDVSSLTEFLLESLQLSYSKSDVDNQIAADDTASTRDSQEPEAPPDPLLKLQPNGSSGGIYCCHAQTGSGFVYRSLALTIPPHQPFYALHTQRSSGGVAPAGRIEEMASTYVEAIRRVQPEGPYRLMGWCSGGIIAFEMAQQLTSKGEQIETLILLDTPALIPKHKTWWQEMRDDRIKLLSTFADTIAAYVGESIELDCERLRGIDDADQLSLVLEECQRVKALPEIVDLQILEGIVAVFDAHCSALIRYEPQPFNGHVCLIEPTIRKSPFTYDAELWRSLCTTLELHEVPGDHHSMILPPLCRHTAAVIESLLARHPRGGRSDDMSSQFVARQGAPLTPDQEINRRVSAAPDNSGPNATCGYVAPRSTIEHQLLSIWCELLAVDRVGIDDDYFELGGDSLTAEALFIRIETVFGRKLPLAVLFQHGTVRRLATLLAESTSGRVNVWH